MPSYEYPRPSVTVDAVVFGVRLDDAELRVLLVKRGDDPFKGRWALPGGFVNVRDDGSQGESLEAAVERELREETALRIAYLEQLATFGTPGRDPRGRVISVAHFGLVLMDEHSPMGGDDADEARWFYAEEAKNLAFDHDEILSAALARLRAKIRYAPIGFTLLPPRFTLGQLHNLYQAMSQRLLDKRNFWKKAAALPILKEAGRSEGAHQAKLYSFDKKNYDKAVKDGFIFDL